MRKGKPSQRPRPEGPRINGRIRVSAVFVVGYGQLSIEEARRIAGEKGLDLVEVQPHAKPPVVKIMDYGKYKYDEKKRLNEQRKKQTRIELKTIKLRPKTDTNDLAVKARHARKFLEEGNRVQLEVRFQGRENAHPKTGKDALDKIMAELADVAKLERMARYENRVMTMVIGPK